MCDFLRNPKKPNLNKQKPNKKKTIKGVVCKSVPNELRVVFDSGKGASIKESIEIFKHYTLHLLIGVSFCVFFCFLFLFFLFFFFIFLMFGCFAQWLFAIIDTKILLKLFFFHKHTHTLSIHKNKTNCATKLA